MQAVSRGSSSHGAGEHRQGAAADDVDEIPNSVIAEAVNNAIAHRNYASIGSIQVEVYSDRIEIISPGRLHRAISVADLYKKHESHAVNPRIARAMYQVKYIETMGTGLTDLLDVCKANGLKTPLLEEVPSGFRIVIWRPERADNRGGQCAERFPEKYTENATENATENSCGHSRESICRNAGDG